MKKTLTLILTLALMATSFTAFAATLPTPEVKELGIGIMQVYDYRMTFPNLRLFLTQCLKPFSVMP